MPKFAALVLAISLTMAAPGLAQAQIDNFDRHEASSAIMSSRTAAAKVRLVRNVPSVGVIRLNFHNRRSSVYDYRLSAEKNAAGIHRLQDALRANPVTRQALANTGVDINQVAGVRIGSGGALRVFLLEY